MPDKTDFVFWFWQTRLAFKKNANQNQ